LFLKLLGYYVKPRIQNFNSQEEKLSDWAGWRAKQNGGMVCLPPAVSIPVVTIMVKPADSNKN
jgi:hypothetical protein